MYAENAASLLPQHPWHQPAGAHPVQVRRSPSAHPPGPPPSQPIPPTPLSQQPDRAAHPYASVAYTSQASYEDNAPANSHHTLLRNFTRASPASAGAMQTSTPPPPPPPNNPTPISIPTSRPNHLSPPASATSSGRPSSRRALTAALELAQDAVRLDSSDDPHAAVIAYGRSISLLSEVMERVMGGEDSEGGRRRARSRSVVAREDEVRRLRSIHDTYAERMEVLCSLYGIPPPVPLHPTQALSPSTPAVPENYPSSHSQSSGYNTPLQPPIPEVEDSQDGAEYIGNAILSLGARPPSASSGTIEPPTPVPSTSSRFIQQQQQQSQYQPPTQQYQPPAQQYQPPAPSPVPSAPTDPTPPTFASRQSILPPPRPPPSGLPPRAPNQPLPPPPTQAPASITTTPLPPLPIPQQQHFVSPSPLPPPPTASSPPSILEPPVTRKRAGSTSHERALSMAATSRSTTPAAEIVAPRPRVGTLTREDSASSVVTNNSASARRPSHPPHLRPTSRSPAPPSREFSPREPYPLPPMPSPSERSKSPYSRDLLSSPPTPKIPEATITRRPGSRKGSNAGLTAYANSTGGSATIGIAVGAAIAAEVQARPRTGTQSSTQSNTSVASSRLSLAPNTASTVTSPEQDTVTIQLQRDRERERERTVMPLVSASTSQGSIAQRRKSGLPPIPSGTPSITLRPSTANSAVPQAPANSPPTASVISPPTTASAFTSGTPMSLHPGRLTASGIPPNTASSLRQAIQRNRAVSQPGRRPSLGGNASNRSSPPDSAVLGRGVPPVPQVGMNQRKTSLGGPGSRLNPQISYPQTPTFPNGPSQLTALPIPLQPTSTLPSTPPADPLRKPFHLMSLLLTSIRSKSGGYITRRLHVPHEVWSQGGAKLTNLNEKGKTVEALNVALEDVVTGSSEFFRGAGRVGAEKWIKVLEEWTAVCEGIVGSVGKKLGVGEGINGKKSGGVTFWGGKVTRTLDRMTNGKNFDSPNQYVAGLAKLFQQAQLFDEHLKALANSLHPTPYSTLAPDIRHQMELRLKRSSEFFASVVLTFVIRDLGLLLDKYARKGEKWLAE